MEISELRAGNIINVSIAPTGQHSVQVIAIGIGGVNFVGKISGVAGTDTISPIPLTEDILLKCGFDKQRAKEGERWLYRIDSFKIYEGYNRVYFINENSAVDMLSLHQLQNLYFALTGRELDVKL